MIPLGFSLKAKLHSFRKWVGVSESLGWKRAPFPSAQGLFSGTIVLTLKFIFLAQQMQSDVGQIHVFHRMLTQIWSCRSDFWAVWLHVFHTKTAIAKPVIRLMDGTHIIVCNSPLLGFIESTVCFSI